MPSQDLVDFQSEPWQADSGDVKHYVLDTNVLLHDPTALYRFEEHHVVIPLVVLEELDRHKKGVADLARNARQVTREFDTILRQDGSLKNGFPLLRASSGLASGRLFFAQASDFESPDAVAALETDKADNQILACAMGLGKKTGSAILVTKDINLRVKALACDVPAQDYRSDRVFSDSDILPTGFQEIDEEFWETHAIEGEEPFFRRSGRQMARVGVSLPLNSFLLERTARGRTRIWRVQENSIDDSVLVALQNQSIGEGGAPLLTARNSEQAMALNLLHDSDIDFVALLGVAGTGKTLMALAIGLEQVRAGRYEGVIITRATVPMGEEIGFLPGDEAEKMGAWLGGTLEDCFDVLKADDKLKAQVSVKSMSFMRGRSIHNKFVIVDEAQNLTAHQMRGLLTRAGDGTKMVVTGNLAQIDTPYLDEGSSGLAWAVKNLQNWEHGGHLILPRGERSRLATFVEEVASRRDIE